jgi:hypothetical protein
VAEQILIARLCHLDSFAVSPFVVFAIDQFDSQSSAKVVQFAAAGHLIPHFWVVDTVVKDPVEIIKGFLGYSHDMI